MKAKKQAVLAILFIQSVSFSFTGDLVYIKIKIEMNPLGGFP